jgi:hypothetical protein
MLDDQSKQVSAMIQALNNQPQKVPCDRKNILKFIQQARQRHPQRATEEIDRDLQTERNAWNS